MNNKYGILLQEGQADIQKFIVVAIPRDFMVTVVTKESAKPYIDKNGQSQKIPEAWANGWSVEWTEDSEKNECRTAIINAMNAFNAKYTNKLTIDQLIF